MRGMTVLAFGDSLTWGYDPATGARHPAAMRWPEALAAALDGPRVLSEGLSGRTTCFDDHAGVADRNGVRALPVALASHQPLDLVIVMLGTNDLKPHLGATAEAAAAGLRRLAQIVAGFPWAPGARPPALLLVAPPPSRIEPARDAQAARLPGLVAAVAAEAGAGFFDAGTVVEPSPLDGVHLDAEATAVLGRALAAPARRLLRARAGGPPE